MVIKLVGLLVIGLFHIGNLQANVLPISPESAEDHQQFYNQLTALPQETCTPLPIIFVTLPKCGTHLLNEILTHPLIKDQYDSVDWIKNHLTPNMEVYREDPNLKKILVIRDLRDMCISASYWLVKNDWWSTFIDHRDFYTRDQLGRLDYFICLDDKDYSIGAFASRAENWINSPNVFVVKFEDIVGERGGGSRDKQIEVISSLMQFLEFTVSRKDIECIAETIFGVGFAFRKGDIGQWKKEFTEEQIELFKHYLGRELISLGYEKDFDWSR